MAEQLRSLVYTYQKLAVLEERQRLARDLHDSVKQQVFAISMILQSAKSTLRSDVDRAQAFLDETDTHVQGIQQELTTLVRPLRPTALEGKDLPTAIRELALQWSHQSGIAAHIAVQGEPSPSIMIEEALFRVVQEALANVARHSRATSVKITLAREQDKCQLSIDDNGQGFDRETMQGSGIGLLSMQACGGRNVFVGKRSRQRDAHRGELFRVWLWRRERRKCVMEQITILIVDDHAIVRHGLRTFFEMQPDLLVLQEADSGEAAVGLATELIPDVILMDLVMPGMGGVEATRQIKQASPQSQIIALTSYHDDEFIFPALHAGALSYVLKDVHPQELVEVVRKAARGEAVLHPHVASRVIQEMQHNQKGLPHLLLHLSERELEVLRLIAGGLTNAAIAEQLVISEKTVKKHVSNILSKLHLLDRTQAAVLAWQHGLVSRKTAP